jgi:selenoprotein W-related protein
VSLTAELLKEFESQIEAITLIPSSGGRFEVMTGDGDLIYSKLETGRHAEPGEINGLLAQWLARQN